MPKGAELIARVARAAAVASLAITAACSAPRSPPVPDAGSSTPQEPTAKAPDPPESAQPLAQPGWSPAAASSFLTGRVEDWLTSSPSVGNNFACATTCHTSLPWALSAPRDAWQATTGKKLLANVSARVDSVSDFRGATPYYGTSRSAVGSASLASEAALNAWILGKASGPSGPTPAKAVSHLWQLQRSDGGFDWMDYGLAPWEDGDELIAAAFVGRAAAATVGFSPERGKLLSFVRRKLPDARPFSRAFALWALRDLPGLWASGERDSLLESLSRLAGDDGAYSWKSLGIGQDGASDPLPTAIALLAFCSSAGSRRSAFDVARAVAWLRSKQHANGSFPSRSPNRDKSFNHTLATDAATGYSLLAIAICEPADNAAAATR